MAGLTPPIDFAHERSQLLRFLVAGAANTAFAYAIYAAGIAAGLEYQIASLAALIAGICGGFLIQGKVAFRSRLEGRFAPFVALWALLYLANIALIGAFTFFGMDLYLAGLVSAIPINAASYLALRLVIFPMQTLGTLRTALLWCVGLVFVARLYIVTHLSLNWDEFLNLSMLYDFSRGEMREIFQTVFIHLFHWLRLVAVNEVDQIVAARMVGLACAALTSLAILHAARRFMAANPALVAVLAFNCFGASFLYGTDFRTDTLATAAMTGAIALATQRRATLPQMIGIGLLIAIGGALTIKSVFFLPTIGILVLANVWSSPYRARAAKVILGGVAASVATFVAILALHASSLEDTASAATFLSRTGGATLLTGDYRTLSVNWRGAILGNLSFWILVGSGVVALARRGATEDMTAIDRIALASFALPVFVPLIYSEVHPYFHPFLIAPVAVLAGHGFTRLSGFLKLALIILLIISAANALLRRIDGGLGDQRRVLALVHRLFPEPVAYIDHTSMVSSFPKKSFFMSHWGVTDYRKNGRPVMAGILRRDQPSFLLETRELLAVDRISPEDSQQFDLGLFGTDVKTLRDNYTRYWGPLFLPRKTLLGSGKTRVEIGGRYRVEGEGRLLVDGRDYTDGDIVRLIVGEYDYAADGPFRIVWAAPPPPASDPPAKLFSGW